LKVIWNGTSLAQEKNEGYKVAEDEIYKRISNLNIDIERNVLVPSNFAGARNFGINFSYTDSTGDLQADILINNRLPIDYSVSSGYNIGFSYWETNKLPDGWVEKMNLMDEIWTTSRWAKDVFESSGVVVPVYDFKLGVDDLFKPAKRRAAYGKFTFMSIGSPSTRKNSQMVVDAFIKLFEGRDDVQLLYKTMDSPDARIRRNGQMLPISSHPQITIVDADLPIQQLSELYDSVDCVVYPTSGEGWGMLPFQSIAKGIPTICTNATACTEYANLSVPLSFEWGTTKMSGIYEDAGTWALPNFDDLCDKMLYVYNHYDEVAEYTYQNSVDNYDSMTWDYAAEGYYKRLCQILKKLETRL
jgi:glycosyltransferase involved in cell wall biosynthesis